MKRAKFGPGDHTFVLCAYGDNPYLGETLDSLLGQTMPCPVLVSTSTPSDYIRGECERRGVQMVVNRQPGNAGRDWNYGYSQASTPLVTIAHQDDLYERDFVELVVASHNAARFEVGLSFTDYYELRGGAPLLDSRLLRVKRLMNLAFRSLRRDAPRFVKVRALSLGDAICCPACTYNKRVLGDGPFDERFVNSCDYATYVRLAEEDVGFLHVPAPLVGHRIYPGSATTRNIAARVRAEEDEQIISGLWPAPVARAVCGVYAAAEASNAEGAGPALGGAWGDLRSYSAADIARMGSSFAFTRLFYRGASLVRLPFSIRGKAGFHYGRGLTTGRNCRVEVFGEGRIEVGENVHIGDNVHIAASESVTIGDDCLFASKVFVSDTSHGAYGAGGSSPEVPPNIRPLRSSPVSIGDRVWLGENVAVLPGVEIGDGCVVGANSTVTRSMPANTVAVGSPAVPIKAYDAERASWVSI